MTNEVKQMSIKAIIDTNIHNLCINETIKAHLDLPFVEKRRFIMPNGELEELILSGLFSIIQKS
ncbi:MAG: hypothetical protein WDM90_16265 [Ferruginibacter sp.]